MLVTAALVVVDVVVVVVVCGCCFGCCCCCSHFTAICTDVTVSMSNLFLADTQLYKRLCPLVCPSVCPSVHRGDRVENAKTCKFVASVGIM